MRTWKLWACPVCDEIELTDPEHPDDRLKCNGLPEHERHKLTPMVEVTVMEIPPGMRAEMFHA